MSPPSRTRTPSGWSTEMSLLEVARAVGGDGAMGGGDEGAGGWVEVDMDGRVVQGEVGDKP